MVFVFLIVFYYDKRIEKDIQYLQFFFFRITMRMVS